MARTGKLGGGVAVLACAGAVLSACGSSSNQPSPDASSPGADAGAGTDAVSAADASPEAEHVQIPAPAACPVVVADSACDKNQRPFVFVHGTYGSGDNFAHVAALLGSNGFCQDRIVGVEYNSLGNQPAAACTGPDTPAGCGRIDAAVDAVLASARDANGNPFTQVDLAGHSQGTSHCGTYLSNPAHAAKVAHYINFSGVPNVGDMPTLSLSSLHDLPSPPPPHHATGTSVCTATEVPDGGPPAGCNVLQVTFKDQDHFAVAASKDSAIQVYRYLTGKAPQYTDVQCGEDPVTIEGISESFGDNVPITGKIELREVSDTARGAGMQVALDPPDTTTGHFGPVQVKRNVAYEFKGFDAQGNLVGYQYFTPFKRSNRLVRLLSPSSNALVASQSTDHIVRSPNHVSLVARWAGGAFRQDLGASLTVDGSEVFTSGNAGADAFSASGLSGGVVGFFMNDANMNGKTDLGLYYSGPFLAFTDVFMDTATPRYVKLSFTAGSEDPNVAGEKAMISNWPSSDAEVLVMFQ
jgi:hypothetical protein